MLMSHKCLSMKYTKSTIIVQIKTICNNLMTDKKKLVQCNIDFYAVAATRLTTLDAVLDLVLSFGLSACSSDRHAG